MSTVGHARVSTDQQSLDQQRDTLTAASCERTFTDQLFGVRDDRPGLAALLDYAGAGDVVVVVVVVVALDRLGRSLSGTIRTIEALTEAGVLLRSLREASTTPPRSDGCSPASSPPWRPTSASSCTNALPRPARARGRHTGRHPSSLRPKLAKSGRSAPAGNRFPGSSLTTAWPSTPRASGHCLKAEVDHWGHLRAL